MINELAIGINVDLNTINEKDLDFTQGEDLQNNNTCLLDKTCTPCQGGVPPLATDIAHKLLSELGEGWVINELGQIYKEYKFNNFMEAMYFANKVAKIAEQEAHHPDLEIAWGRCAIKIWTHKINGLTENDFILAAKINGQPLT